MATVNVRFNRPQSLTHMAMQPGWTLTCPWGRGVGKTEFIINAWAIWIAKMDGVERDASGERIRGVRIVHIMPTFTQFVNVYARRVEAAFSVLGKWGHLGAKINHTRWSLTFPGGSSIQCLGTIEANNNRGIRCDIVTIDEADDIEPSDEQAILSPYLSEPWSLGITLLGGTPRRGRLGLLYQKHKLALDKTPKYFSFHATYRDAPEQVSQAYVESKRIGTDPILFQREWECNFDSADGMVYSMFNQSFHVREPNPRQRWTEFLIGIDHGFVDPGVLLLIGVIGNGRDAECWVLDEVYKHQETTAWWVKRAKLLAEQWNMDIPDRRGPDVRNAVPCRWFADPSRPDTILEYVRNGIRVEPAKNSIPDGLSAVGDRLIPRLVQGDQDAKQRYARLYIHPRCKETIAEFGKYKRRRDPRNPDKFFEEPADKDNHCFVAGTMVMTDRGEIPIEDIRAGMRVLTREGYFPVKAAGMTLEAAETYSLDVREVYDDGDVRSDVLRGTGDHLVWVEQGMNPQPRGWHPLRTLRWGRDLLALERPRDTREQPCAEDWPSRMEGRVAVEQVTKTNIIEPVYDLTVDGPPEFFANGILVHNCMDALRYPIFTRFGGPSRERHESGPGWGVPQSANP